MKITTNFIKQTKRHLSASGSILLPLALKWRLVAFIAGVILAVLVTPCLAPHMAAAASITLTVPKEPLTFSITPSDGGTFGKSAAGTIEIQTDALAGYTLNIKAKDGKAELTNEVTGSKISPISSDVSENDFTSAAAYNNMWGFSFNKQGASNNNFHPIPGDAVGTKIGSTEVPNTAEDIYNIVLGARVDNSLATGAYSNTFIVVASANPVPYKVKYESNAGSDQVSGMPGNNTSATTSTQSFALPAEEPKRSGYEFIGWCDTTPNKESNTVDVCQNGKSYQASDTYTLSRRDEAVTLYAMWVDDGHIMQNWKGCGTAELNKQITLVDIRDNREYYVAKLADGNCWMTENLDLFIDKNTIYTVADTDLDHATDEEKAACKEKEPSCVDKDGNYQWNPVAGTHETGDTRWDDTDATGADSVIYPQSYDPGDKCWKGERTWAIVNTYYSTDARDCSPHDQSHYHIGNYYTYTAAVAQNNTQDHLTSGNYNTSICPLGWQLPVYSGSKSFDSLQKAISEDKSSPNWVAGYIKGNLTANQESLEEDTIHAYPYYFIYGGHYRGVMATFGSYSHYLNNEIGSGTSAHILRFQGNGLVNAKAGGMRFDGLSVRCVLRQ